MICDSTPFLVPALPDQSLFGCVRSCRARVGGHARRRRGGTLGEHAGEARSVLYRRHVQPCERARTAASRRSAAGAMPERIGR